MSVIRQAILASCVAIFASLPAQAGSVVGTKAIADIGATSADTGNIFTASTYSFGLPVAASGGTGDFATYAPGLYFLTASTLDLSNISTFTIGNAAFGTFTANSFVVDAIGATSKSFILSGVFQPGTDFPGSLQSSSLASLSIGFTQIAGPGSTVSASGTLTTAAVPEPSSIALSVVGMLSAGLFARRRLAKS